MPPRATAVDEVQSEQPARCDTDCAKLIEDAELTLQRAERLRGSKGARAALALRAGQGFLRAWVRCTLKVAQGSDLSCKGGPEVVPNMVRAFELSAISHKIIFARLIALDRRWASAKDPNAEAALRAAAQGAEREAAQEPTAGDSPSLLEHATYARLALGEPEPAMEDLGLYRQH